MENARGDEDPLPLPGELKIGWWCEQWHSLPEAGGVMEQDYGLMHRMQVLGNIHRTVNRYINLSGAEIHSLSTSERNVLRWLKDMGLMFNANS